MDNYIIFFAFSVNSMTVVSGNGVCDGAGVFRLIRFVAWFGGMTLLGVAVALAVGRADSGRAQVAPLLDLVGQAVSMEAARVVAGVECRRGQNSTVTRPDIRDGRSEFKLRALSRHLFSNRTVTVLT